MAQDLCHKIKEEEREGRQGKKRGESGEGRGGGSDKNKLCSPRLGF